MIDMLNQVKIKNFFSLMIIIYMDGQWGNLIQLGNLKKITFDDDYGLNQIIEDLLQRADDNESGFFYRMRSRKFRKH